MCVLFRIAQLREDAYWHRRCTCRGVMKPAFFDLSAVDLESVAGGAASCAIAGDSIAYGLGTQMKQCTTNAKVGTPSHDIIHRVPQGFTGLTIISAGSNDPMNPHLADNLNAMRRRAGGGVTWIAPVNPRARSVVESVAHAHGDRVVTFTPGHDNVHPQSYAALARAVQGH
jgi:hypothetical protein